MLIMEQNLQEGEAPRPHAKAIVAAEDREADAGKKMLFSCCYEM